MVKVSCDPEQKLVEVTLSGLVKMPEAVRASTEVKQAMMKFGPQEAALMIDMVGFMPMSNDVLPIVRGMSRDVISFFQRAALVQEFSAQYSGGRKAIEPPPGVKVPIFPTREEALDYLLKKEV